MGKYDMKMKSIFTAYWLTGGSQTVALGGVTHVCHLSPAF